jgi:hypothetical protein
MNNAYLPTQPANDDPAFSPTRPMEPRPEDAPFVVVIDGAGALGAKAHVPSGPISWPRVWLGVSAGCFALAVAISLAG